MIVRKLKLARSYNEYVMENIISRIGESGYFEPWLGLVLSRPLRTCRFVCIFMDPTDWRHNTPIFIEFSPDFRKLVQPPYVDSIDWSKWHVFWVDERVVPKDHDDSNYKLAYDGFLSKVYLSRARSLHWAICAITSYRNCGFLSIKELILMIYELWNHVSDWFWSAAMIDTTKLETMHSKALAFMLDKWNWNITKISCCDTFSKIH